LTNFFDIICHDFCVFCPLQYIEGLLWETYFSIFRKGKGASFWCPKEVGLSERYERSIHMKARKRRLGLFQGITNLNQSVVTQVYAAIEIVGHFPVAVKRYFLQEGGRG